jgi:hypothetical protein
VDHVVDYSKGGETTQINGKLRCGFDNRRKYQQQPPTRDTDDDDDDPDDDDPEFGPDP